MTRQEKINISIHAPVWGATIMEIKKLDDKVISIHAPVWGATKYFYIDSDGYYNFNPRARMGRDSISINGRPVYNNISIHAPVWGATYYTKIDEVMLNISIHAPVWGATHMDQASMTQVATFQSTRPYGARQKLVLTLSAK